MDSHLDLVIVGGGLAACPPRRPSQRALAGGVTYPDGGWRTLAPKGCSPMARPRPRRGYPGTWLPTPVETDGTEPLSYEPMFEGRSKTLTPRQRAVLLLREVFDYGSISTASAASAVLYSIVAPEEQTHLAFPALPEVAQ